MGKRKVSPTEPAIEILTCGCGSCSLFLVLLHNTQIVEVAGRLVPGVTISAKGLLQVQKAIRAALKSSKVGETDSV
jgi:hypothetical protein